MGERLLRAVERWLTPWYDRAADERRARIAAAAVKRERRKAVEAEKRRRDAIAVRIESERAVERVSPDALGSYRRVRIGR